MLYPGGGAQCQNLVTQDEKLSPPSGQASGYIYSNDSYKIYNYRIIDTWCILLSRFWLWIVDPNISLYAIMILSANSLLFLVNLGQAKSAKLLVEANLHLRHE